MKTEERVERHNGDDGSAGVVAKRKNTREKFEETKAFADSSRN